MNIKLTKVQGAGPAGIAAQALPNIQGSDVVEQDFATVSQLRGLIHVYSFDPTPNFTGAANASLIFNGFANRLKAHVKGRRTYNATQVMEVMDTLSNLYVAYRSVLAVKAYNELVSDRTGTEDSTGADTNGQRFLATCPNDSRYASVIDTTITRLSAALSSLGGVPKNTKRIIDKYVGCKIEAMCGTKVVVLAMVDVLRIGETGNACSLVTNMAVDKNGAPLINTITIDSLISASSKISEDSTLAQIAADLQETEILITAGCNATRTTSWKDFKLLTKNMLQMGNPRVATNGSIELWGEPDSAHVHYSGSSALNMFPVYFHQDSDGIDADLLYGFTAQMANPIAGSGNTVNYTVRQDSMFALSGIKFVSDGNVTRWITNADSNEAATLETEDQWAGYVCLKWAHPDMYVFTVQNNDGGDHDQLSVVTLPENYGVMMVTEDQSEWDIGYRVLLNQYNYWDMAALICVCDKSSKQN